MTIKVIQADREAALKPCPFCGATDEEFQLQPYQTHDLQGAPKDWTVECANCAAFGPTALAEEASIAAWNTRASHADPLRRALEKIAQRCDELRAGTDDWFDLADIALVARHALSPSPAYSMEKNNGE